MRKLALLVALVSLVGCADGTAPTCDLSTLKIEISKADALALCGKPDGINYDRFLSTQHEQWVYRGKSFWTDQKYIYVENGKVSSVQWSTNK